MQDITSEIEPRLRRLERQAERTHQHEELSTHVERLLRTWYGFQWNEVAVAADEAQRIARERSEQHEKRLGAFQSLTEKIDRIRKMQSSLRNQLADWHGQRATHHAQGEERRRELAVLSERDRQHATRQKEHSVEVVTLNGRLSGINARITQTRIALAAAGQELTERELATQEAQLALNERLREREELMNTRNTAFERLTALSAEMAQRQSRWDTFAERIGMLEAQIQANHDDLIRLGRELDARSSDIARVDAQADRLEVEQQTAEKAHQDTTRKHHSLTDQLAREQTGLGELREIEAKTTARFELLGQLRHDFAIYDQAVRVLFSGENPANALPIETDTDAKITAMRPGILGVLAQMIQVSPDHSTELSVAIEAALGAYASAIVVKDWRAAEKALTYLRSTDTTGRVILLAAESPLHDSASHRSARIAGVGESLAAQVDCSDELQPLVDRLLGHAFLVSDLDAARAAMHRLPKGSLCVTPEGDVLRSNSAIEGGRPAEQTSPMAQEQEWVELNTRLAELGSRREAWEENVAQASSAVETVQKRLAAINSSLDERRARIAVARSVRDKLSNQADRIRQEIKWRQSQISSAEEDLGRLQRQQEELLTEIAKLKAAHSSTDGTIREITSGLESLTTKALSEKLASSQMALATARQMKQGQHGILRELENSICSLEQDRDVHIRRIAELEDEQRSIAEHTAQLGQAQTDVKVLLDALSANIEPAEVRLAALDEEQRQLETTERVERARLREFENHLAAARLEAQRGEDKLKQLRRSIEDDLGLVELEASTDVFGQTPLPLDPLVSKLPFVQQLPEGVEDEISRLRVQLRRLGAINPNAPEEYVETLQRFEFLEEQSFDLVEASDSLRQVIAEMDGLIQHAFRQTFDAVAIEFSETFTTLFGGGNARLELSDPDNLAHTGVEIVAQPPGKRPQSLASLSGGERALTAVSLIFSILKISPPPFCILDEVDAMLDEANVTRFRSLLESLTEHTQVVIISHNRGTIGAAATVYGVSMGADSVSQVFSLQMEGETLENA